MQVPVPLPSDRESCQAISEAGVYPATSVQASKVSLNDDLMKSLAISQTLSQPDEAPVCGMQWMSDGNGLLSCTDDGSLHIFCVSDVLQSSTSAAPMTSSTPGTCSSANVRPSEDTFRPSKNANDARSSVPRHMYSLRSKHGGLQQVTFVCGGCRRILAVTVSADDTKQRKADEILLWNIESNVVERVFELPVGVTVVPDNGLCAHPTLALFLVACTDNNIRYYSMHRERPLCLIASESPRPTAAFDVQGFVFACAVNSYVIHFFDCSLDTYERDGGHEGGVDDIVKEGAMKALDVSACYNSPNAYVSSLLFSSDGNRLVLGLSNYQIICVGALFGDFVCEYKFGTECSFVANGQSAQVALPTFTPDAKYLLCGGRDQLIYIWTAMGNFVTTLSGHKGIPKLVKFNPTKALLATAGRLIRYVLR